MNTIQRQQVYPRLLPRNIYFPHLQLFFWIYIRPVVLKKMSAGKSMWKLPAGLQVHITSLFTLPSPI